MSNTYVIGIDFGTDSVRSLLAETGGRVINESVHHYKRWGAGAYCDKQQNRFRQHPLDYLEGLEATLTDVLEVLTPDERKSVKGISVDTTGSTPVAVDGSGKPLSLSKEFSDDPDAMFVLWKDHTAIQEADEINRAAHNNPDIDYTRYVGGIYSSEWFWAKMLHILRANESVRRAAVSWVEHCDWIPFELTGGTDVRDMKRSRCAAGHKAMWHHEFGGLPPDSFFTGIDPLLSGIRDRLFQDTVTADVPAGTISQKWAEKLGLSESTVIGTGAFDAHMGAVGGEIEPYFLSRVMGTSTCDILVVPQEEMAGKLVRGICGQVDGSVIPGMTGLEAGQSAFGDVYAWFQEMLLWPVAFMPIDNKVLDNSSRETLISELKSGLIRELSAAAENLEVNEESVLALDWLNGRRTPDANQKLKAAVEGLDLGVDAPRFFRALVEGTCLGARAIVERFQSEGIPIKGVIGLGGVASKSPFVMQTLANVLKMPVKIARSEQTCALGAAMFAAVASGIYDSVEEAKEVMGSGFDREYLPVPEQAAVYDSLYNRYISLGSIVEKRIGGQ